MEHSESLPNRYTTL